MIPPAHAHTRRYDCAHTGLVYLLQALDAHGGLVISAQERTEEINKSSSGEVTASHLFLLSEVEEKHTRLWAGKHLDKKNAG